MDALLPLRLGSTNGTCTALELLQPHFEELVIDPVSVEGQHLCGAPMSILIPCHHEFWVETDQVWHHVTHIMSPSAAHCTTTGVTAALLATIMLHGEEGAAYGGDHRADPSSSFTRRHFLLGHIHGNNRISLPRQKQHDMDIN